VAPRGQTGQVTKIFVKEGDYVNKGRQVLKLDDAVYLKQLQQVESQLEFAKNIYERQKNLWSQNIGTEVQLLTAKNNVETLEKQIATIKEQWSMTNVYAENSGVVETISVRVGELFNVGSITIVNNSDLKVSVTVPENYLSRVNTGQLMKVYFPDVDKTISTKITRVGQVIGLNSRGFVAEGRLPSGLKLKPNQLAQAKILDHASPNAVVIPMNVLQTDEKGKYVFVRVMENGKAVARKRQVIPGEIYGEEIEVKQGLKAGEELITQGYQGLYEGQTVTTEVK
jgi:RND family efflux transporter MFP subunit